MFFTWKHWLSKAKNRTHPATVQRAARRRQSVSLTLEILEDRLAPATFVVNTNTTWARPAVSRRRIAIAERPLAKLLRRLGGEHPDGADGRHVKFEERSRKFSRCRCCRGWRDPDVINDQPLLIADSFVVPDECWILWAAPSRHAARENRKPSTPEEMLR